VGGGTAPILVGPALTPRKAARAPVGATPA